MLLREGEVTLSKVDDFINRVIEEKGYNLQILRNEVQKGLQSNGIHNMLEDEVYSLILQRISQRLNSGG